MVQQLIECCAQCAVALHQGECTMQLRFQALMALAAAGVHNCLLAM
jgi:hypothetical protein